MHQLVISIGGQDKISGNLPLVFAAVSVALGVLFLSKLEMLQRFQSIRFLAAVGALYVIAAILMVAFYFTYPAYANLSSPQAAHSIPLWVVDVFLVGGALSFVLASTIAIGSGLFYLYRSWPMPTSIEQINDKKEIAMTDLHSALKTEIVGKAG